MVAVIGIDTFPFLTSSGLTCNLENTGIDDFLAALRHLIVRKPKLEVATKRLLHQQVKIPR